MQGEPWHVMEEHKMLCKDIISVIERMYPPAAALEWDNVGLLAGRDDKEVKSIYVALDAGDEVIDTAADTGADMLITHHPLIFGGLKAVTNFNFIGSRVLKLISHDISYYAMHTNYDVKRMGILSLEQLGIKSGSVLEAVGTDQNGVTEGIGQLADIESITLRELCMQVKRAFLLDSVRVFGNQNKIIRRMAICPGSGKSVIGEAILRGADVLITGDIGHHEGIDAQAQGLAVIDAGHYGLEHIFLEDVKQYLEESFPDIKVEKAPVRHPFTVI